MEINYDKLVKEWSDRMSGREPIYTNRYHKSVLRDVMKDFGYPLELVDGFQPITKPRVVLEGKREEATDNTDMMETAALIGTTGGSINHLLIC